MSTTPNPDFSLDSKKRIAAVVRTVQGAPRNRGNDPRPANPRDGGGLPVGQYRGQVYQMLDAPTDGGPNPAGFGFVLCQQIPLPGTNTTGS